MIGADTPLLFWLGGGTESLHTRAHAWEMGSGSPRIQRLHQQWNGAECSEVAVVSRRAARISSERLVLDRQQLPLSWPWQTRTEEPWSRSAELCCYESSENQEVSNDV